ncbi:hypothetical protein D7S70_10480 [Ralstonia pickettii]|jgi:hypothetical protein|nr:hypothetical protein [Ralstonia pickettii]MBB0035104.1 hypothetical protein [Ralstonia pickettii]MBB0097456.1 hypothetical protein [Ralstonia pickettii]MBB0107252.1 hypothetical protein [Ralstonia pickettii]MBB0128229.1 hypothetical protein [Ralstonia pickettii]
MRVVEHSIVKHAYQNSRMVAGLVKPTNGTTLYFLVGMPVGVTWADSVALIDMQCVAEIDAETPAESHRYV